MADLEAFYRVFLSTEYLARKRRNPRYSLRAYAKNLQLDNGFLSKLLRGKTLLSLDLAGELVVRLKLSGGERHEFILSAAEEQKCHALYLLDPSMTACDPTLDDVNRTPKPRKKR